MATTMTRSGPKAEPGDAKKIARIAKRKAAKIAADETINRSTRARAALKVKADALDEIAALK